MPIFDLSLQELQAYSPPLTRQPDFDDFWRKTLTEAESWPLNPELAPVDYPVPELRAFTARYREMKYSYILEIKYIKKGEKEKNLDSIIKAAEEQVKKYSLDEKFKKTIGSTTLIKLVLVFSGTQLKYINPIP